MTEENNKEKKCPLCGKDNHCGNLAEGSHEACWCSKETFPQQIFELVPQEQQGAACICKECLDKFKETLLQA